MEPEPQQEQQLSLAERQNKRLDEIRKEYEYSLERREDDTLTPDEWAEVDRKKTEVFLRKQQEKGIPDNKLESMRNALLRSSLMIYGVKKEEEKENAHNKITSCEFRYEALNKKIRITSESCRHWRTATIDDIDNIVFLKDTNQFGMLSWIDEEHYEDEGADEDEEYPEELSRHVGVVDFIENADMVHRYSYDDCFFEDVLIVPDDILNEVDNEAPPGKRFSGRRDMISNHKTTTQTSWSPAPDGQAYFLWDESKGGEYLDDEMFAVWNKGFDRKIIDIVKDPEKYWNEFGCVEYWCPVLNKFLSDGERRRQEHWFHNGNGSAQQRYYYSQSEMLDKHGGLDGIPRGIYVGS